MNNIDFLEDNSLIICEEEYKIFLLKKLYENKEIKDIKFMTKKNFFNKYFFSWDEKAIYYLIKQYNLNIDVALMILNSLYFINDNIKYKDKELNRIKNIKQELINQNLLEYDSNYKKYLLEKNIYVIGYEYFFNYEEKAFKDINAKYICKNNEIKNITNVYEAQSIEEEIEFVAIKIAELLSNKIDIKNIKITGIDNSYYNDLKRIFSFYNIPLKIPNLVKLNELEISKKFLDALDEGLIKAMSLLENINEDISLKIISICNKFSFVEDINILKDLLKYYFSKINIDINNNKNSVEILPVNYPYTNENVFFMNFNEGGIYHTFYYEGIFSDEAIQQLNEKTSDQINEEIQKYYFNKINNFVISYKKYNKGIECYPSHLIEDLNLKTEKIKFDNNICYSIAAYKSRWAIMLDSYYKYGEENPLLPLFQANFDQSEYNSYDNSFKKIKDNNLEKKIKDGITLSYSSLTNYVKCRFKYYLSNILKIEPYKNTLEALLGTIYHDVLQNCLENDNDVKSEINKYLNEKNINLDAKQEFFINKMVSEIEQTIDIIKKQKFYIGMDKEFYEKRLEIIFDKKIPVKFVGVIDKIFYKEINNRSYIALVDYKTGNVDIDLKPVFYGFNLQLPIYIYLIKNAGTFHDPIFSGFYIQRVLNSIPTLDASSYEEEKTKSLKLNGYSNKDLSYLEIFDKSYENSEIIKSMKIKNDGNFSSLAKVLDNNQITNLINYVSKSINDNIDNILSGNFEINPKILNRKNVSCEYCPFGDICYKKSDDYVYLDPIEDLSFLESGDEND